MKTGSTMKPIITASLLAVTMPTLAHTGHGTTTDWVAGLSHPFSGTDHLLVMLAIGLWASLLGGAARWFMPIGFLAMMSAGAWLAMRDVLLPSAELGVQLSLLMMGFALWSDWWSKRLPATAIASFFAIFHGQVHGAEVLPGSDGLAYAAGFLTATAALHALGLLVGHYARQAPEIPVFKAVSALCTGVGMYFLITSQ